MQPTNRCFIGNLPYNCTEEMLYEAFRTVGPVVSARLVFDRETGKMKGFGFVEYNDVETAASAVRNLNGYDLAGRAIRVDHAEPEKNSSSRKSGGGGGAPRIPPPENRQQMGNSKPLPSGTPLPPGVNATDAISQTLATIPPEQLLDIMSHMKSLVTTSPDQARTLLNGNPQLAYALFQAMVLMKVVNPDILQRMLSTSAPQQQMPSNPPPQQYNYPPQQHQAPPPQNYYQQQQQQQPPQQFAPQPVQQQQQQAPPQQQSQAQQAALLQQVMSMTQAQIDALGPEQRNAIMALRAQLGQYAR